jgi:large subunit ribosomal protein L7e
LVGLLAVQMSSEAAKVAVPESLLKKRKREEQWLAEKKEKVAAEKKKASENRKLIFIRAKQYAGEYEAQVRSPLPFDRLLLTIHVVWGGAI